MRCPNCQREIPETALVCGYCGQPVAAAAPPPTRPGLPGWAWGAGGVLLVLILVGVLFAAGVIALPGSREAMSAPPTLKPNAGATKAAADLAATQAAGIAFAGATKAAADLAATQAAGIALPTATPEGLVCRDDFTNELFWPVYETSTLNAGAADPGYWVAISAPAGSPSREIVIYPSGPAGCNAPLSDVRVKMVGFLEPGSAPSTTVGLAVRGDSNWLTGTLAFYTRPFLEDYSIGRRVPDAPPHWVVGFTESAEVKLAADGTLTLEVEARGNDFTFWVNGELVEAIEVDVPAEGFVGIGLAVANDGWARFVVTDFEVWRLP